MLSVIIETTHKIYGRVMVDEDALNSTNPFVEVRLLNERPNLPKRITVGKVALDDKGGYIPKQRGVAERTQQHLPLVGKAVKMLKRPDDDWEELFSVGCLGLIEANARFNDGSNYAFASFAKPYVMGYIKNHINPERNGEMNMVEDVFYQDGKYYEDPRAKRSEVMDALYKTLPHMTDKQQRVMKMLYIEGHTMEITAEIMGIRIPTVQTHRDRALQLVKDQLL
jgi:RNA polymerase sigma factor (sigma-70 family)